MIKSDYGKFNCPIYEEKLNSGMNLILIPRVSKIKTAILYIPQGYYLHDDEINSTKINYGCPFLLKEMILNEETVKKLNGIGSKVTAVCKHSYTYYKFETMSSLTKAINVLLNRIKDLNLTDAEVEKYKQVLMSKNKENDILLVNDNTVKNMFINSPMKNGSSIKNSDLKMIHLTEMKKFLYRYYSLKSLTLFVSGDITPNDCLNNLVSKLNFPIFPITSSKEKKFDEDYSKVKEKRDVISFKNERHLLSFGIKFDKRQTLFEKYGELIFAFYEIALDVLTDNVEFNNVLKESKSSLVYKTITEGYEDTFLLLTFKCDKYATLSNRLSSYSSSIDKNINNKLFNEIKKQYLYKSSCLLSSPSLLIDEFARVYADNLPFTYIMKKVSNLTYTDFMKILKTVLSYPRSVTYLENIKD